MALTLGRLITIAAAAPELLADADAAAPELRRLAALLVEGADLMKAPALKKLAERVQRLAADLKIGEDLPAVVPVLTPMKAVKIAAGNPSPAQQALFSDEERALFERASASYS